MRLGRQGYQAWHVPEAVVEHFIREEQLKQAWVLRRAVRWGRGRYRMAQDVKLWLGIPRHLFRDIPREGLLMAAAKVSFREADVFRSRWRFNVLLGIAQEAQLMAREPSASAGSR